MTIDELQQLMLDVLDGTASAEEEAALASALESDPTLRQRFEDARVAGCAMEGVGLAELPQGLRDEIRASIRSERRRPVQVAGRRTGWRGLLVDRPLFSFASAFATGAAAGILLFALLTGKVPIGGTTHPPIQGVMRPLEGSPTTGAFSQMDFGDATVGVWGQGQELCIRIESKTPKPSAGPIEIDFDPTTIEPTSALWSTGTEGRIEIAADGLTVTPRGAGICELRMRIRSGSAASVQIHPSAEDGMRRLTLITTK